jgi:hypothetical protein
LADSNSIFPSLLRRPELIAGKPRPQSNSRDYGIVLLYFIAYLREWVREQAEET